MPAKNIHHEAVVGALRRAGWTITHDPPRIPFGGRDMYVDLGAMKAILAAEKDNRQIAVEVQSFLGESFVRSLQEAVGQYVVYREVMTQREPDRVLYMAVSDETYETILSDRLGQFIVARLRLRLLVFDPVQQRIIQWID